MIAVQMKIQASRNATNQSVTIAAQAVGLCSAAKIASASREQLLDESGELLDASVRFLEDALAELRTARSIFNAKRSA